MYEVPPESLTAMMRGIVGISLWSLLVGTKGWEGLVKTGERN